VLRPQVAADTVIADKADDADARVLEPRAAAGKTAVILPKAHRTTLRPYDKALYKSRPRSENLFLKRKQYRAIATRDDKTDQHFLAAIYTAATIILLN
jgi:transposase